MTDMAEGTLFFEVPATIEHRNDRWAAINDAFGFCVYGVTEEEVRQNFREAMDALKNSFDDLSSFRQYLDRKRVLSLFSMQQEPSASRDEVVRFSYSTPS